MDCFPDFFLIQFVVGMSESHAFYIWIMYLRLAERISSKNVLVQASVFLTYTIVSSTNRNMLTPFSIHIPFVSFSFLIVRARTSKIILNSNGESRHPCSISDFSWMFFEFPPFITMLTVGFVAYKLYTEVCSFSKSSLFFSETESQVAQAVLKLAT